MTERNRWRRATLRKWLAAVDHVIVSLNNYRHTSQHQVGLGNMLAHLQSMDPETTRLFGGWTSNRVLATRTLLGAAIDPFPLVTDLANVFECLKNVKLTAAQILEPTCVPQTHAALISYHEALVESLSVVDTGPSLSALHVAWIYCCSRRNIVHRVVIGELKPCSRERKESEPRRPALKFARQPIFGARAHQAPKPKWGQQ